MNKGDRLVHFLTTGPQLPHQRYVSALVHPSTATHPDSRAPGLNRAFSYLGFYFEPRHIEETDVCMVGGGGEERTIAPNTPHSVSNLSEQTS